MSRPTRRIAVLGGTGFVGTALVSRLHDDAESRLRSLQNAGTSRVRQQLQQVIDRYVSPTVGQPVKLELVGEIPLDVSVRDAVLKRELLMEKQPGSPAGIGMSALGLKLRGVV